MTLAGWDANDASLYSKVRLVGEVCLAVKHFLLHLGLTASVTWSVLTHVPPRCTLQVQTPKVPYKGTNCSKVVFALVMAMNIM